MSTTQVSNGTTDNLVLDSLDLTDLPPVILEPDLAKRLGKTTRTLRMWEARGVGPERSTLGRTIIYAQENVLRWLAEGGTSRKQKRGFLNRTKNPFRKEGRHGAR